MNNNDILRRLRYTFDFSNKKASELFSLDPSSTVTMTDDLLISKLAKEEDADFSECSDVELTAFLDGFIVSKRGLRETDTPPQKKPENFRLSKNDILKKLRIGMNYREQEMLDTLELGGSNLSKSELGALFRKPNHKHFRACGNQVLRNFIKGLTKQHREN